LVRNFFQLGALGLVCDPAATSRAKASQLATGVEVVSDFDAVFDRANIHAVVLATPAETHHRLALRALCAGKDVLVEKPLALNYQQGLEMRAEAARNGRILMVGHLLEYHPAVLKLRSMVAAGHEPTLAGFLEQSGLDVHDVYTGTRGWSDLCEAAATIACPTLVLPVAVEVAETPAEEQEPAVREDVRVHDPRERCLGEAEIGADRRQRHVHDRRVEHDHQVPQAEDVERQPACSSVEFHRGLNLL
jgi:hypothetical protein